MIAMLSSLLVTIRPQRQRHLHSPTADLRDVVVSKHAPQTQHIDRTRCYSFPIDSRWHGARLSALTVNPFAMNIELGGDRVFLQVKSNRLHVKYNSDQRVVEAKWSQCLICND
jgi:hypothetical protein